jgi:hypothetical protein
MLKETKKEHAAASLDVKKREANVKKGERALEDKVSRFRLMSN